MWKKDKLSFFEKKKIQQQKIIYPRKKWEFYKKFTENFWIFLENNK